MIAKVTRGQSMDSHRAEAAPRLRLDGAPLRIERGDFMGRQATTLSPPPVAARAWQPRQDHHYTVAELSEAWNVSTDFVRDLFRDEKDVVRWVRSRPGKRRYVVIRIPANVVERVYRRAQRA